VIRHRLDERARAVLFSPAHGILPGADLAKWILDAGMPVRLQIQTHKYIWSPDARGV
jgi:7-carboxy-7-deazaguanine synthase